MKKIVYLSLLLISLISFSHAFADDTDLYILTQVMQQVPPDALILLDLSGSMDDPPWGAGLYYDPGTCTHNCGDNVAYYPTSGSSHTRSCSSSGAKYAHSSSCCSTGPLYTTSTTTGGSGCTGSHSYNCPANGYSVPPTLYYDPGTCTHNCGDNVAYYPTNASPHTAECDNSGSPSNHATWGDSTCLGPFYQSSGTGHTTNCSSSKLALAKKAVFNFLDTDNGTGTGTPDGIINSNDQAYLKIRMGYMRYYYCGSSSPEVTGYPETNTSSYSSGCNTLIYPFNTAYNTIYCNSTSCTSTSSGSGTCVARESASGGTPLAAALQEAKYYLDYSKNGDDDAACRQKFVILITDGDDTYACGNNGSEGRPIQYKGRRETVAQARALANAGYYVFVVGFGSAMPTYLQNTLNWAAYYGRTRNTDATQSITDTYSIPFGQIYPLNVTQCMDSTYTDGGLVGGYEYYYANTNDPGQYGISGYAFIAQNESQLDDAIKNIRNFIITLLAQSTSYVAPVVPISQFQSTSSENRMYLGMFKPTTTTMWKGNIKKYGIQSTDTPTLKVGDVIDMNGNLAIPHNESIILSTAQSYWSTSADGGDVERGGLGKVLLASLTSYPADSRNIYTYMGTNTDLSNSVNAFSKTNTAITTTLLGVTSTTEKNNVIDFIHGWDVWGWDGPPNSDGTFNPRSWILGAFVHSRPVVIHYASYDVIYAGANDGMLHAFKDTNGVGSDDGTELWGFIPPDLLPKLDNFNKNYTSVQIFVDGSPKAWTGTNPNTGLTQTILIFGERRGGNRYYALDVTDPYHPQYLWYIGPDLNVGGQFPYAEMGQSWSTPILGKIKNGTGSKWVAFIGGGYDNTQPTSAEDTTPAGTDTSGRAIYVVDITNGSQVWKYSHSNDSNMKYCIPSDITPIDVLDKYGYGEGLIERLYVGDVGGEIWRFDIGDMTNTASWTGEIIFKGSGKILYPPDVTFENNIGSGTYDMLFFGTGDREKPNGTTSGVNKLYAIKDYDTLPNPLTALTESSLTDVTSYGTPLSTLRSSMGWYIRLNQSTGENPNPGEKCSGAAVVLGGAVYYTTFTPTPTNLNTHCSLGTGSGNVYVMQYQTGNAMFDLDNNSTISVTDRSMNVGAGIPSGIIIAIINGTVTGYGGVAGGVFSPQLTMTNAIWPLGWRLVF